MKRFITYLYGYERGSKGKNTGFIKADIRGTECRMEVHLRTLSGFRGKGRVYVLVQGAKLIGLELGEILMNGGRGDMGVRFRIDPIGDTEYHFEDIVGIAATYGDGGISASQWKDGEPVSFSLADIFFRERGASEPGTMEDKGKPETLDKEVDRMPSRTGEKGESETPRQEAEHESSLSKEKSVPKTPEQEAEHESLSKEKSVPKTPEQEAEYESLPAKEKSVPKTLGEKAEHELPQMKEKQASEKGEQRKAETDREPSMPEGKWRLVPPRQETTPSRKFESEQEKIEAEEIKEAKECEKGEYNEKKEEYGEFGEGNSQPGCDSCQPPSELVTLEEKWAEFSRDHQPISLVSDKSCNWLRIEVRELRELPKCYWYLGNNSFLLHGFFNYHHILLGKEETEQGTKWYLGVPGVFLREERVMATLFGFATFYPVADAQKESGFGYWLHSLEKSETSSRY